MTSLRVRAPTRAAQVTLGDLQKGPHLSSLVTEFCFSLLKLPTGLQRLTRPPPASEDTSTPVCRGWLAVPRTAARCTALHLASTSHGEKPATNYTNRTAPSNKGSAVWESSSPVKASPFPSHLFLLTPSQDSSLLSLFRNLAPLFLPSQEAAPMGAAAATARNSPNQRQPGVICGHKVDYYFLRVEKKKKGTSSRWC